MTSFDAIVVGAGHNGLVCAAWLARSGLRVRLVEAAGTPGHAMRSVEFAPGFRVSPLAHILNRLHPDVVSTLDLARHGLRLGEPAPTIILDPLNGPVVLDGAYGERIEGVPAAEASAWAGLRTLLLRQAGILKPFLTRAPPRLGALSLTDKTALGAALIAMRRQGREEMREFLRMLLMNVHDVADEHLADDRLKGLLAFDATLGINLGPRSPTSLLGLYYRLAGDLDGRAGAQVIGQADCLAEALVGAAGHHGVSISTGSRVSRILVEDGSAVGIELADGTVLKAPVVASSVDPHTTMLGLVGAPSLDIGYARRVSAIRMKGAAARLHLALDAPPAFTGLDAGAVRGRLVIAGSADRVERAYNPSKYGDFSREPVMEITLPGIGDPSFAPDGACVLSATVQFAPYELSSGWETGRGAFLDAAMSVLERHAPGLGATVLHSELLTPADIEARYRVRGGHWHHGDLQADQMLFSRPVSGADGYATPIGGLYLCGAGAHPGGGVSGVPGMNAARAILAGALR